MNTSIKEIAKRLDTNHNVCIRIIDEPTGLVVSEHIGHNSVTNTLLTGIGHYLMGEGLNRQGELLSEWIPQYISLGTMGLSSQDADEEGLPLGVGDLSIKSEEDRFNDYVSKFPGYGSDGYDSTMMNNRKYAGLGPQFADRSDIAKTTDCELISPSFPRAKITFRDVIPEYESEYPRTIDIVFSATVSTGALAQFREPGRDYIFISEVGLWSTPTWSGSGSNGLLAGYRIGASERGSIDMSDPTQRRKLKSEIIRIGINQVAQIIWKIQLGGISQISESSELTWIEHK